MDAFAYLVPALGCAAMMGAMMWMMGRGRGSQKAPDRSHTREIDALREEVAALRDEAAGERSGDG